MTRIPITAEPYQQFQVDLEGRLITMRVRFGHLTDAWTFDILDEDLVDLVRGKRITLRTDLLRGHAWQLGGLVAVASHDLGDDPGAGDFGVDGRVNLFHLSEAEVAAAKAA